MKETRVLDDIKLLGIKNFAGRDKLVDYYVVIPSRQERIYAFSKVYTDNSYNMCKGGKRINEILCVRSRDSGVMRLVKYTKHILPYLIEEYQIPMVA